uniref:Chaperone DnaJ C-terminal domain-containing protein n=1 Tax=Fagus sylvatica TaxID=28930 RepID=A0A2N9INB4_FAGSY
MHLSSSTTSFPSTWDFNNNQQCIGGSGSHQCSAFTASASSEKTWTMRATFPEYVVALATIVGSILFVVVTLLMPMSYSSIGTSSSHYPPMIMGGRIFGGIGIACLPLGLIFSFIRRPKAVITRSQYIKEATELGKKARELKKAADSLHQEEISGSKGRKWRKNVKAVGKVCFTLGISRPKAVEEILKIDIKPSWKKGTKITFPKKGNQEPGITAADLIFVMDEKPHPIFKRDGNDLS